MRDYAVERLGTNDAVPVIDETGFLKQDKASCGVGRQYTGSAGKVTNCQIGVFAAYVSTKGHGAVKQRRTRLGWAVALLAYLTSLTPGSTCLHVSADRRRLYLHVLDAPDPPATIARFRRLYERWVRELAA